MDHCMHNEKLTLLVADNVGLFVEVVVVVVGPSLSWPTWVAMAVVVVVTRSQRGHIVRVDAGRGWELWGEITVGGPTFIALSSSTSFCNLLFCSAKELNHLLRYSHSISVCFSLLLLYKKSTPLPPNPPKSLNIYSNNTRILYIYIYKRKCSQGSIIFYICNIIFVLHKKIFINKII